MSCDVGMYRWCLVAGDDTERIFTYRDTADALINLSGYTAEMRLTVGSVVITVNGIVAGPEGTVTVLLTQTLTSTFLGDGAFKLRLTSPGGLLRTLVHGTLEVIL